MEDIRGASLTGRGLVACAILLVLVACSLRDDCGTEGPSPLADLLADLNSEVVRSSCDGQVIGIACSDLAIPTFGVHMNQVVHAASTMKLPVMIEFFRRVDASDFTLATEVVLENRFASIVDGSMYALSPKDDSDAELYERVGHKVALGELCRRMIERSSNLATNVLIERLGAERIQATIEALGTKRTKVLRGVEDQLAYDRGLSNTTCARDLATLLMSLVRNQAASPDSCSAMIAILEGQRHRSMLPQGLPVGARIAHKTGQITAIHHDAAIIWRTDGQPFVLVVLTKGFADEDASAAVGARIARSVWSALTSPIWAIGDSGMRR